MSASAPDADTSMRECPSCPIPYPPVIKSQLLRVVPSTSDLLRVRSAGLDISDRFVVSLINHITPVSLNNTTTTIKQDAPPLSSTNKTNRSLVEVPVVNNIKTARRTERENYPHCPEYGFLYANGWFSPSLFNSEIISRESLLGS